MSLSNFFTKLIFLIVSICIILAFVFTILFQNASFQKEKELKKTEVTEIKKNEVKREVERVINYIKYRNSNTNTSNIQDLTQLQNEILQWIKTIRFGDNGYLFVNTLDKKALLFDGKIQNPAIIYPNNELMNLQLKSLEDEKNNFIEYKFKKLNNEKLFEKIAYIQVFKEWGWIIGSGFYLDDATKEIENKNFIYEDIIYNELKSVSIVFVLLLLSLYFLSKKISTYINLNINNLILEFKKASKRNKKIEYENLTFNEFISLAKNINEILEKKLEAENKLKDHLKILDEHIISSTTDLEGKITSVSKAFCEVSGYSKEELIGSTHKLVRHDDIPDEIYRELWDTIKAKKTWRGEFKNQKKSGEIYWVEAIIEPLIQEDKVVGYTSIRHNITNKKKVEYLSITDELTQLYNRRHFNTIIEEELNRAKRRNDYISFLMLDIDYFKKYNDEYGHQKGDKILKEVSHVLKESSKRVSDFAFRIGGEEFALIFSSVEKENCLKFARSIKEEIENLKIENMNSEISNYLTVSIGLICKKANEIKDSKELYKAADVALYEAKNSGRNQIRIKD
jgi:diguanylate cyclase (GGDEF)-like protein/PAS domain S-box-containing protein